jgi:hypothetical protein
MPDIYTELSAFADERRALHELWRDEVSRLDDKRNQTAGEIYKNTKKIEAVLDQALSIQYARTWVHRWVEDEGI